MILTPKNKRKIGHLFNLFMLTPVILLMVLIVVEVKHRYDYLNEGKVNERQEYRDNYF